MTPEEIPYEELKQEIIEEIQKHSHLIISTSEKDKVSSRLMRFIKDGLTVYCFTDQRTRKYQQIKANKNVAVAADSLSIEGVASLTGSPKDPENAQCLDVFRKTLPDWYETWEKWGHFDNPNVKVIKITPKRITLFKMKEFSDVPESYFALLDPVKKKAYKLDSSEYVETQVYKNK